MAEPASAAPLAADDPHGGARREGFRGLALGSVGVVFGDIGASFFLGRRSAASSAQSGLPLWQDKLFIFLLKTAANPTDVYKIPPGRVVELGTQVTV